MTNMIKSKTFWTAIAGIIVAIGGGVTGEMTVSAAVQTGITCLLSIFLRDGIERNKE